MRSSWTFFAYPLVVAAAVVAALWAGGPALGFVAAAVAAGLVVGWALRSDAPRQGDTAWRGPALRRLVVPLAVGGAGAGLVLGGEDETAIVGWGVVCVAIVVAISLAFFEIGLSEDRERARPTR